MYTSRLIYTSKLVLTSNGAHVPRLYILLPVHAHVSCVHVCGTYTFLRDDDNWPLCLHKYLSTHTNTRTHIQISSHENTHSHHTQTMNSEDDGNRCTHDRYDVAGLSDVIERCMSIMVCGGRFLAVLTIGQRLHELASDDLGLMERISPFMLQACEYVASKVCAYVCISVFFWGGCVYVRTFGHVRVHLCVHVYIYVHGYLCMYMNICASICTSMYLYVFVYVWVYVYVYFQHLYRYTGAQTDRYIS